MAERASIKALAVEHFDKPPSVIDVPAPEARSGEVLVRMRAASINNWDAVVASGVMRDQMTYEFPTVIGMDVAGIVESVGDGAEGFAEGDRVFGTMGMKGALHDGSFGELATPKAPMLRLAPDGLEDQAGGSLGTAGTTAESAVDAVGAAEGATILVVGATGGVGSFAVQIAALRGAHVIATARAADENFVTSLGAAETVDYSAEVASTVRERYPDGIDGLIDLVNFDPAAFAALAGLVRAGGRATSSVGGAGESSEIGSVSVSNSNSKSSHLEPLADLVVKGKLRVSISRTYALAESAQAIADFTNQHTLGKLLITMERA
jgi:NADPH:quinone reductase-like Zn-dependent oxidoreductase